MEQEEIPEVYKRVSDLEIDARNISDSDLLLITQKKDIGYKSGAATVKKLAQWQYKKFVKPDIDYLEETKADNSHGHKVKDISDLDLSKYALKREIPSIPTKVSQFQNDAGYLTAHQNLSAYALKTDIPEVPSVPTKVSELENDCHFISSHQPLSAYALKTDIPEIPTLVSYFENDLGYLTAHQSLSGYALKSEIPTIPHIPEKISELSNDSEYITIVDVPTKVSQLSNDVGFLTQHQDVSMKADQEWTVEKIDEAIAAVVDSSPDAFNTLKKIADWISSDESGASLLIQRVMSLEENKADLSSIPTKTSQLSNDSGFITANDLPTIDPPTFQAIGTANGPNVQLDISVPIAFIESNAASFSFNSFSDNAENNGAYTWEVILKDSNLLSVSFNSFNMKYVGKEELDGNTLVFDTHSQNTAFSVRLFKDGSNETWLINHTYVY